MNVKAYKRNVAKYRRCQRLELLISGSLQPMLAVVILAWIGLFTVDWVEWVHVAIVASGQCALVLLLHIINGMRHTAADRAKAASGDN